MKLIFYRVTPHSVVFFRDPRPFSAGEQALARLQFPPRLTPFLGAIRTKYLQEKACKEQKENNEVFDENELKQISVFWFSLVKDGMPILPLPFDASTDWKVLSNGRFVHGDSSDTADEVEVPILKWELRKGSAPNEIDKCQKDEIDLKEKMNPGSYLPINALPKYKNGELPSSDEVMLPQDIWQFENRIGIGLKPGAKTVDRSKFYRMTVARPQGGVGFLVGVELGDIELPHTFTTRLGGEGHIAVWEKFDSFKAVPGSANFSELVALTHVPIISDGEPIFEIKNWCINKLDVISGWDYKEHRPKPLVKALKPGAVLSVEQIGGSDSMKIYEISFGGGEGIFVVKDLAISIKDGKTYLTHFKPKLGEPDTLFLIKN